MIFIRPPSNRFTRLLLFWLDMEIGIAAHHIRVFKHRAILGRFMLRVCLRLLKRAWRHDLSKYNPRECHDLVLARHKYAGVIPSSPEYIKSLELVTSSLDYHFQANSHHPEHFMLIDNQFFGLGASVEGMPLLDVIEMLCDWKANSVSRSPGESFASIIRIQKEKYNITEAFASSLLITAYELGFVNNHALADYYQVYANMSEEAKYHASTNQSKDISSKETSFN